MAAASAADAHSLIAGDRRSQKASSSCQGTSSDALNMPIPINMLRPTSRRWGEGKGRAAGFTAAASRRRCAAPPRR
eukprot:6060000-Pleurochrysis_carterae.AAC.3